MIVAPRIDAASSTELASSKRGTRPAEDAGRVGRRDEHADREPDRDDREQAHDDELERARAAPRLQDEQHDRDGARDEAAPDERDAEQQVERDRAADHLGEVGGHGDELGLQPVRAPAPPIADAPPSTSGRLSPVTMPSFAERYWMSQAMTLPSTDHPDEQVAVLGAGGHVARDVAGVEVGDAGHERGADQPGEPGRGRRPPAAPPARRARGVPGGDAGSIACSRSFGIPKSYGFFGTPKAPHVSRTRVTDQEE